MGSPKLKATFDTIIEAFLFLDKNGDGKLNKKDMIKAMNEDFPMEKSPTNITKTRFSNFLHLTTKYLCKEKFTIFCPLSINAEEMDWNKDGKVSFREFLFSLLDWVGFESTDDNE